MFRNDRGAWRGTERTVASAPPDLTLWPFETLGGLPPVADADEPGRHLWVIVGAIAVPDPERPLADLIGADVVGPGCFKCERQYSRKLARRPCTGSLS